LLAFCFYSFFVKAHTKVLDFIKYYVSCFFFICHFSRFTRLQKPYNLFSNDIRSFFSCIIFELPKSWKFSFMLLSTRDENSGVFLLSNVQNVKYWYLVIQEFLLKSVIWYLSSHRNKFLKSLNSSFF
jgi:hypothetical protein